MKHSIECYESDGTPFFRAETDDESHNLELLAEEAAHSSRVNGLRRAVMGWAYKSFVDGRLVADSAYGTVRSKL